MFKGEAGGDTIGVRKIELVKIFNKLLHYQTASFYLYKRLAS
ncbi:MAG: hypothetical protein JWQ25_2684 [Daejeonella sp.]|nr:hypothetical protein [Daejeonella sp.]